MEPPEKPDESDCCNSGCTPCIFDVYEEHLKKYNCSNSVAENITTNCIHQLKYSNFTLLNVQNCTKHSNIYIFESTMKEEAGLFYSPGQHFLLKAYSSREKNYFTRAYTPIPRSNLGRTAFAVLVKLYERGEMSKYLRHIKLGETTVWRGPYGDYIIDSTRCRTLMIAQGTGIAPIFAVISKMLLNEDCDTVIKLYYCCRSQDDIMLREELYEFCRYWNFSYEVFLSDTSNFEIKYNEVVHPCRLEKTQITDYLCGKEKTNVLICGSEVFMNTINDYVKESGVEREDVYKF